MKPNPGPYTVTYFRADDQGRETVVSRYDLSASMMPVYRSAPAVALGAARQAQGLTPANGFRITDESGAEVLAFRDKGA